MAVRTILIYTEGEDGYRLRGDYNGRKQFEKKRKEKYEAFDDCDGYSFFTAIFGGDV